MANLSCFVIAPIGTEGSSIRKRSDAILKHVIQPVVQSCGYDPAIRADHLSLPGIITRQVIERVIGDDLVVADLSDANANVFYELAIRHMVRKPVIQLVDCVESIPFDIAQSRTIEVNHQDLESVESAKHELTRQINSASSKSWVGDNPISMAVDLNALQQADDPIRRSIAELISTTGAIKSLAARMERDTYDSFLDLRSDISNVLRSIYDLDPNSSSINDIDDIMGKLDDIESKLDEKS